MINQLTGTVAAKRERYAVINVGGVGFRLYLLPGALSALVVNETKLVTFFTYLAVREDALDLYGFQTEAELDLFELLISVSGIGPKGALAILSLAPPGTLTRAIAGGDINYLTKISGIGRKRAEKIILELKDKVSASPTDARDLKATMGNEVDALEALRALGYSGTEAREALKKVTESKLDKTELTTSTLLKAALKFLSR